MFIVYVLRNRINDKYYVGQTIQSIYKRMRDHRYNKKSLIGRALNKYVFESAKIGITSAEINDEDVAEDIKWQMKDLMSGHEVLWETTELI